MSSDVFAHPWLSGLFSAPEIAHCWSGEQQLAYMLAFERALTVSKQRNGSISDFDAKGALHAIDTFEPDLQGLKTRVAQDGVVVPELVAQLRAELAEGAAIHTGATSQDVIDTATAMALRDVSAHLLSDMRTIVAALDDLMTRTQDNQIMGRTRMQAALPIAATHRIATWQRPLANHITRLEALAPSVSCIQLGGATGDRSAFGSIGDTIAADMAATLGLHPAVHAWHTDRSGIVGFGQCLALITGTLAKMGHDICLMSQQGLDEISLSGGGASSAMPHKTNPVLAELLVTLGRYVAGQSGVLGQAMIHEQERSGAAWMLEWMILPPMTMAAGSATRAAIKLIGQVESVGTLA